MRLKTQMVTPKIIRETLTTGKRWLSRYASKVNRDVVIKNVYAEVDIKRTLINAITRIGYSDKFGQPSNLLRTDCGGISLLAEEI